MRAEGHSRNFLNGGHNIIAHTFGGKNTQYNIIQLLTSMTSGRHKDHLSTRKSENNSPSPHFV